MTDNEIREYIEELRYNANMLIKGGYATAGISTHFSKSADLIEELLACRAIGTVEQCRETVEKSKLMSENNNVITIGLYFEIHDAYMYGGVGTVGYANINMDLKASALTKGNLSDYIEKQKQGVAKVCEVDIEKVLIISRTKYEEETTEEDCEDDWSDTPETENT